MSSVKQHFSKQRETVNHISNIMEGTYVTKSRMFRESVYSKLEVVLGYLSHLVKCLFLLHQVSSVYLTDVVTQSLSLEDIKPVL